MTYYIVIYQGCDGLFRGFLKRRGQETCIVSTAGLDTYELARYVIKQELERYEQREALKEAKAPEEKTQGYLSRLAKSIKALLGRG